MASSNSGGPGSVAAGDIFNVNGMVAVITGGGTGIGLMMARALANNGAEKVYILGRRVGVLHEAARTIGKSSVIPLECDVTSKDSLQAAAAKVQQEVGYINLLVCNSGVGGPQSTRPTKDTSLDAFLDENWAFSMEEYTQAFTVNVAAVWYTTLAFLRLLDAGNKKGNLWQKSQVLTTSSIAGFNKVPTGGWAYGSSKAACTHLMKQLSSALPIWDVRANIICPGLYPSDLAAPILARPGAVSKETIPLDRVGDEQDMAGAILYLVSRAGAYCDGTVIVSDGGRLTTMSSTF